MSLRSEAVPWRECPSWGAATILTRLDCSASALDSGSSAPGCSCGYRVALPLLDSSSGPIAGYKSVSEHDNGRLQTTCSAEEVLKWE